MPDLRQAPVNRTRMLKRTTGINPRSPKAHRVAMRTWEKQGHKEVMERRWCEAPASGGVSRCGLKGVDDHHVMHRVGRIPEVWAHHPVFRVLLCDDHHDREHGVGGSDPAMSEALKVLVIRRLCATWPDVASAPQEHWEGERIDVIRKLVAWLCARGEDPRDRPMVEA
jgi:hypothetical protein